MRTIVKRSTSRINVLPVKRDGTAIVPFRPLAPVTVFFLQEVGSAFAFVENGHFHVTVISNGLEVGWLVIVKRAVLQVTVIKHVRRESQGVSVDGLGVTLGTVYAVRTVPLVEALVA